MSDPPAKPPDIAELAARGELGDDPRDGCRVVKMFPKPPMRQPGEDDDEGLLRGRELLEAELATAAAQGDYDRAIELARRLKQMGSSGCFERPLNAAEIFAPLPPINWTIERLALAPGRVSMIAGYGYSGKTVSAQSLALSVAAGREVWGEIRAEQGPVLHVDYEQGEHLTRWRYQRLARGLELPDPAELPIETLVMPKLRLVDESEDTWCRYCDGKRLTIIDSYRVAASHVEENSSQAREPLDLASRISIRTGCVILVLHHARKPQRDAPGGAVYTVRGSGSIFDATGSCIVFVGEKGDPPVVHHEKNGVTGNTTEPFALQIRDVAWHDDPLWGLTVQAADLEQLNLLAARTAENELRERVLGYIGEHGGCGTAELRAGVGGNGARVSAIRDRLEREGWIKNHGSGRRDSWRLEHVSK